MQAFRHDATPRLKPIYPVYRVTDTTFRIGAQFGITAEIDDPEGQLWALVHLLDGTLDVAAVVAAMRGQFPMLSADDIEQGIVMLDDAGFLEDARPTAYDDGDSDLNRFVGNVNYFSHYGRFSADRATHQDTLRNATVVLLGLGGGGSHLLPLLSAAGIGKIVAVDYDRVELTNLNRQLLYREADIGRFKTDAAAQVIREMNALVDLTTITRKIESAEDARPIVRGADLVICAIDEPPFIAQMRVNRACLLEGVPCLYGFSQLTSGRMFSVLPFESGCVDCLHLHYSMHDEHFISQFRGFQESNFNPPTIAFVPHIARLCGLIADEAVRLLTGYCEPQSVARQVEFDFESGALTTLTTWPRYADACPTCGTGRGAGRSVVSWNAGDAEHAEPAERSAWTTPS